jgi:hypothetical protein
VIDPGEKLDSFDDIWRSEERVPASAGRPVREDIWGETAPTYESPFVLPSNWLASAPRRRLRRSWIALGLLIVIGIAAATLFLLLRAP